MGLDIRLPIGLMFTTFGVLLTAFGLFGGKAIYERSLGINVNLGWGLVMLAFGILMTVLGLRRPKGSSTRAAAARSDAPVASEYEATRSRV